MKSVVQIIITLVAAITLWGCGNKSKNSGQMVEIPEHPKTLVLYYSQTGATKQVADEIHSLINSDICEVRVERPYDGDYDSTIRRWVEENEKGELPALSPLDKNIAEYDTIFLGFPIWGGTYANPVKSLIADNDFEGKTIVTFATFGSGGISSATEDLRKALPKADVIKGYGVRNARIEHSPKEIKRFLIEKGFADGKVVPYAVYSAQQPVTEKETGIFNAACSDYKFPLGTPLTFGKRTTPEGTDYKFVVRTNTPDGTSAEGMVYVTVPSDENLRPEFTLVER